MPQKLSHQKQIHKPRKKSVFERKSKVKYPQSVWQKNGASQEPPRQKVLNDKPKNHQTNTQGQGALKECTIKQDLSARQIVIDENNCGQRLDNFLLTYLKGVPKTYVYRIIRSGEVRINKGRVQAQSRVHAGDVIRIPPVKLSQKNHLTIAPAKEFPILYEDSGLLAINKPAGIAVHGGSGVSYGVIEQLRQSRRQCKMLELIHRLDKETSGILLVAKKRSLLTGLQDQFRERETDKTYLALVKGVWMQKAGQTSKVIDEPLYKYLTTEGERRVRVTHKSDPLGKRSVTIVRLVQAFNNMSLLAVTIKTGRTHQIRVHLAHLGYPIVGDEKYGDFELNREVAKKYRFSRMFLHAYQLSFVHPQLSKDIQLQAVLPLECQTFIQELKNETDSPTSI